MSVVVCPLNVNDSCTFIFNNGANSKDTYVRNCIAAEYPMERSKNIIVCEVSLLVRQMELPVYIYLLYCMSDPFWSPGGPALRANVGGRIGNRVCPAESVFSAGIGSGLSSLPGCDLVSEPQCFAVF